MEGGPARDMECENQNYTPTPWNEKPPSIYYSGDTLKHNLPTYLSSIREHYGSSAAPRTLLTALSPCDHHHRLTSAVHRDPQWGSVVMATAPSVVSVSIFTGVQRKIDCTGVIIKWDDSTNEATVITSAKLARLPRDEDRDDYYIVVRLFDGEILPAREDYVDYYHNIMTVKVSSDARLETVELSSTHLEELEGTEALALKRDFYTCNLSDSTGVIHNYYPYFGCEQILSSTCAGSQAGEGGPLVTRTAGVCGINFFDGSRSFHPLPTSIIRSCLDDWNSHGIVVQPWFGFTVVDITELPYDAREKMATFYLGACGLNNVIKQVYEGSPADEAGVCPGDLVVTLNGLPLAFTTTKYHQLLVAISHDLSASCARQTLDSSSDVQVLVVGSDNYKEVCAENLAVDDRRLCFCWPEDEDDWYREPLFGSQTDYTFDMGVNNNRPSWLFNQPDVSP